MPLAGLRSGWNCFWWGTTSPRLLALLRVVFALVAIWTHLSWWPEVELLLGPKSQSRLIWDPTAGRGFSLFHLAAHSGLTANQVHGITLIPLLAMLVGLGGRWATLLTWVVVLGWYQRTSGASTGGDRLLRFALLYLCVGRCTAVWSVDAWLAHRRGQSRPHRVGVLPVRLIQVQWAGMYLVSGLEKAGGSSWRAGTAIHYAASNRSFARLGDLLDPVLASAEGALLLQLATWTVLVWELAFPLAMLGRRSRTVALMVGIAVHLGIGLTMAIGPFTLVTLAGYLAFCDRPGVVSRLLHRNDKPLNGPEMQSSRIAVERG